MNQKKEREFFLKTSTLAVEIIYKYVENKNIPFFTYDLMVKLNNCKSNYFINAYMNKLKLGYIQPNIKKQNDNPLDTLLQVDHIFEKEKKESKLVEELIDFAFALTEDKPTEKNVMQVLIKNPKIEH